MSAGQDRENAARRVALPVVALRAAVDRFTRGTEDRHVVHDRLPGHAERQGQLRAGDRSMTLAQQLDDPHATARSARLRHPPEPIRVGGLYLCDNTLGYGAGTVFDDGDGPEAIRAHNGLIAEDERFVST